METSEYLDASTSGTLNTVVWVAASLAMFFVALRIHARAVLSRAFGVDDVVVIIATILLVAYAAVCSAAASIGLGRHLEYVAQKPNDLIQVALLADIGESLAIMACSLSKTSFAITLLRIFVKNWAKAVLWFVIITINVVNVLAALFVFLQCKDPRHLWNPAIPSKCWPVHVFTDFSLFVGAYSGAQDFVLALIPWTILWNLQMRRKEKFGVAIAMSLGVFAGVTAIVKTTYLVSLSQKSDFTYALPPLLWWAAAEDGLTIVAASIPTLRPVLKQILPRSMLDGDSSRDKRSYPSKSASNKNYINMFDLSPKGDIITTVEAGRRKYYEEGDDRSDRGILKETTFSTS